MKTTLDFDGRLIRAGKARVEVAQEGKTCARPIQHAHRDYLQAPGARGRLFRADLLTKRGRPVVGVNLDDRDMLYERMAARES